MKNRFDCDTFSMRHVCSVNDVESFARYLVFELNLNFHPDDDFECYAGVPEIGLSPEEVLSGNMLMDECFDVCSLNGADIYEVMGKYLGQYLGMVPKFSFN